MPLTRAMLKGMGLTEEQVGTIIDAHVEVKRAIEEQRDALRDQLDRVAREKQDLRAALAGRERDAARAAAERAYRRLLAGERIPERFHDRILRLTDLDALAMDGDALADADALREAVRRDWGDYVAVERVRGVSVDTPPDCPPARPSVGQIMAIPDADRRQREIARNHDMFGF